MYIIYIYILLVEVNIYIDITYMLSIQHIYIYKDIYNLYNIIFIKI